MDPQQISMRLSLEEAPKDSLRDPNQKISRAVFLRLFSALELIGTLAITAAFTSSLLIFQHLFLVWLDL
jgi:hypothetical protein